MKTRITVLFLLTCLSWTSALISVAPTITCDLDDDAPYKTVLHLSTNSGKNCLLNNISPKLMGKRVTIRILAEGKVIASYFSIRSEDNALETRQTVDRERLCAQTTECCKTDSSICEFTLKVSVQSDDNVIDVQQVAVRVIDKNDNYPKFPHSRHTLRIPEVTPAGTEFALPYATDDDTFPFSIAKYEIEPSHKSFELIQQEDFLTRQPKIKIRLTETLDRETKDKYTFVITAFDRGNPRKSGSMTLDVEVIDSNDHVPLFKQKVYSVNISEDTHIGYKLLQVEAEDLDEGLNAQIDYDISPLAERTVSQHFTLDRSTGWLRIKSSLDYETTKSYLFKVIAKDRGTNPNSDEATVKINVIDVNDCVPRISIDYFSNDASPFVEESEHPLLNMPIAAITIDDKDSGPAGQVTCVFENIEKSQPNKFFLETLFEKSYKLILNGTVDREQRSSEKFRICCTDRGVPSKSQCRTETIKIKDINDEKPVFQRTNMIARLYENQPPNSLVIKVEAEDKDEQPNNILSYAMDSSSLTHFSISQYTGQITTKVSFDREQQKEYIIIVTAQDRGNLTATATVTVSILDINDEKPKLTGQHRHSSSGIDYLFEVEENVQYKTEVGKIVAEDGDEGAFGTLRYSIMPSQDASNFVIDSSTGIMYTNRQLDREKQSAYHLRVLVVDNPLGNMQHTVTASVKIVVLDLNDCKPVIQFPTAANNTFPISYKELANQLVLQVSASDADEGANGILQYLLHPSDRTTGLFFIDASDGKIRISRQMTENDVGRYHLVIRVEDSGVTRQYAETSIIIVVDRRPPSVHHQQDLIHLGPQQSPPGLLLVSVVAVTCLLVLLLLVLTLYLCHRRGILLDGTLFCLPPPNTPPTPAWKEDQGESLSFLTNQRLPDKKIASVNSTLHRSGETVVTLTEGQYTTLGHGKIVKNSGAPNKKKGGSKMLSRHPENSSSLDWGYYEAGCEPPAYYDLETRSKTLSGSLMQSELSCAPQTDQMSRRKIPQDVSMYDLLQTDQTLAHQGKVYSIPKASFV